MKEEAEGLLHDAKVSRGKEGPEESANAAEREDVSGVVDEMTKLQRLMGDLQQQLSQHQDARGWIEAEFKPLADAIYADDGVMGKLDFIVTMLMSVRSDPFDTPRHACVLPPWKFAKTHGLSEDEQMPEV